MTSVLFIWVLSAGQLHLEGTETFYTLEACLTAAARKAENAGVLFEGVMTKTQVRAYCSPKRLGKEEQ